MPADLDSRAYKVAEAIGAMTPPIKPATLRVWAMRQGWEFSALDEAMARARTLGLLHGPRDGLPDTVVPSPAPVKTPAPAAVDPEPDPVAEAAPEPTPPTSLDCLCRRTAPHKNYGCPEHGGARITTKQENTDMPKDWISSSATAVLLGCSVSNVLILAKRGKIKSRKTGEGARAPVELERDSVIAYHQAKRKAAAERDLLPATPTKRKALPPKKSKAIERASQAGGGGGGGGILDLKVTPVERPAAESPAALLLDVRALVRFVDKGYFSQEDAWNTLRGIVAGL